MGIDIVNIGGGEFRGVGEPPVSQHLAKVMMLQGIWDEQDRAGKEFNSGIDLNNLRSGLEASVQSSHEVPGWSVDRQNQTENHTHTSIVTYTNDNNPLENVRIIYETYTSDNGTVSAYQVDHFGGRHVVEGFRIGFFPEFGEYRISTQVNKERNGYTFTNNGDYIPDPGGREPNMSAEGVVVHTRQNMERWVVDYPMVGWSLAENEEGIERARQDLQLIKQTVGGTYEEALRKIHGH